MNAQELPEINEIKLQTIITYIANIVAIISLRALVSYQALRVYGGLLLLIGCLIGHVAMILLGIACLYFGLRERDPIHTDSIQTQEKAE